MLLRRFYHPRLAQSSYLIACSASREAVVIDPHRDVGVFLAAARADGVRITAVTETHVHADFLSGSHDLAAQTGARLYLSGEARGASSYTDDFIRDAGAVLLRNGYVIRVGAVRLEVMHTPGHTPEHLTFLVTDTATAAEPMGAVTGDFVFVGDVGRPDLLERTVQMAGTADVSARQLFHSLGRLARHADYLQLWPGHSAGSACGKGMSAVPQSTLGYERRHNWALRLDDEEQFVTAVLEGQPEPPAYFSEMKRINARGPRRSAEVAQPTRVAADVLVMAVARGATVIDARPAEEYALGHLPGTINVPGDRAFLTWVGSLVPVGSEVMLVSEEREVPRAVTDLGIIGFDRVVGFAGPEVMAAWRESGHPLETLATTTVDALSPQLPRGHVTLLDVRSAAEWTSGHIPDAVHIPLTELPARLGELSRDRPLVVYCQSGARSAIAASVLTAKGFSAVEALLGGLNAWHERGQSVVTGPDTAA